jgi:hypothetical protein
MYGRGEGQGEVRAWFQVGREYPLSPRLSGERDGERGFDLLLSLALSSILDGGGGNASHRSALNPAL